MVAGGCVLLLLTLASCADASRIQQSFEPSPVSGPSSRQTVAPRPTITPSAPPIQPINAGFEQSLSGSCPKQWTCTASGGTRALLSTTMKHEGRQSLQINVGRGRYTMRSGAVPALPQRTYSAAVWRRSSTGRPSGGESVRLLFYDAKRRLVGSGSDRGGTPKPWTWEGVAVKADAPAGTAYVEVEVSVDGPDRTVWLDGLKMRHSPILEVWGGTGVRRGDKSDIMTLQVTTPTPGGVHIGTINAFGQHLSVAGPNVIDSDQKGRLTYTVAGSAGYDPKTRTVLVRPGGSATIHVKGGRFTPTPGTGFPLATLGDPVAQSEFFAFVAAQNFNETPSLVALPNRSAVQESVDKLAKYLDGRMTKDGGWGIAHPYWPGEIRSDPQAIAVLTQGYLKRAQASSDRVYESRARRGLEWLVNNQRRDGSFGLPWGFGAGDGHFNYRGHYPKGTSSHPVGAPLGVVTVAGASTLLEGFKVYGDARYLAAAIRAMDYLLHGRNGFQWLDAKRTRGSVPYCDLEPILKPGDPRIAAHDVVPALKNTSVEVYNIDGAVLSFLKALYVETGDKQLLTYGDAIATNLAAKVRADGSIPYSWYEPDPHSAGYANISYTGLLEYSEMRGRQDWVDRAGRGFSWMANHARSGLVPTDSYASVYGLNLSGDVTKYVTKTLVKQGPDGSFSDNEATRTDAVFFAILSSLLLDMGG